jgi:hypothetical protein
MITRQQYMTDSEHLFQPFISQFVNENVKMRVLAYIGKEALLNSKDEHLNDIPMKKWDYLTGFSFSTHTGEMLQRPYTIEPIDIKLLKETGEGVSSATLVCIYKEAARQLIKELKDVK